VRYQAPLIKDLLTGIALMHTKEWGKYWAERLRFSLVLSLADRHGLSPHLRWLERHADFISS
jgi:hypothetical protein